MGRLIEIQDIQSITDIIKCKKGDIISFSASGGQVQSGEDVIEILGFFIQAYFIKDEVIQLVGTPNTVMFLARCPGKAKIKIINSIQLSPIRSKVVEVTVES